MKKRALGTYWLCTFAIFTIMFKFPHLEENKLYLLLLGTLVLGMVCGSNLISTLKEIESKLEKGVYLTRTVAMILVFSLTLNLGNKGFSGYVEDSRSRCYIGVAGGAVASALTGTLLGPFAYGMSIVSGGVLGSAIHCH